MDKNIWRDAEILWNYLVLHEHVRSADLLLVLGSIDDRVAHYAAALTKRFSYGAVMFSGGVAHSHDLLMTTWQEPEADHFYEEFKQAGGESHKVLLERQAQNTGQNATYCHETLLAEGVEARTIQLVTKPYMQRRVRATFEAQWNDPASRFFVAAPRIAFRDYPNEEQPFEKLVNIMVGDLQRIAEYPACGFQSKQEIPEQVRVAWERLVSQGFTKHII